MATRHGDNGWRSRKLWLAYVAMFLILCGYLATAVTSSLWWIYGEYVAGILGAAAIYSGSNSFLKYRAMAEGNRKKAADNEDDKKDDKKS